MQREAVPSVAILLTQDDGSDGLIFLRHKDVCHTGFFCAVVVRNPALELEHITNGGCVGKAHHLNAVRRRIVNQIELLVRSDVIGTQSIDARATGNQIPLSDSA